MDQVAVATGRPTSTPAAPRRVRAYQRFAGRAGLRIIVPALLIIGWYALSQSPTSGLFVAPPGDALARVFTDFFSSDPAKLFLGEAFYDDLLPSLGRAMAGLTLAIVAGMGLGILLGMSRVLTALFAPLIHLGRSLPSPALLGVFFLLFGTGDSPKIFLIAFSVVWPILLNTIDGVQSIGTGRMQAAAIFKINRVDALAHIILPGSAPKVFAGIRTAMSLSLIIMIISELQKSENGLGYLLVQTQRNFDYTGFWAVLIVLAVLGVLLNIVFKAVERRALAWHRGATAQHD
ncbi:ABC transporter permease [Gordonia sp. CPCC 206044]|uniref:ABC transporter permease n=1 Tax=Gordonia sp. CPCC 206044 TaxID=3140793 RepID=UPI003AF347A6